jgi:hypothetical protein
MSFSLPRMSSSLVIQSLGDSIPCLSSEEEEEKGKKSTFRTLFLATTAPASVLE